MNNSIASKLSYEQRKNLADINFKIGSVFKFFDKAAKKEKMLILVAINFDKITIAFVRINSQINSNFFPTAELRNEHLELLQNNEKRPFLRHTSYVDCSNLVT